MGCKKGLGRFKPFLKINFNLLLTGFKEKKRQLLNKNFNLSYRKL
jgi:hypothetical protein